MKPFVCSIGNHQLGSPELLMIGAATNLLSTPSWNYRYRRPLPYNVIDVKADVASARMS